MEIGKGDNIITYKHTAPVSAKKGGRKKKQIEGNGKNATDSGARHGEHFGGISAML